MRQPFERMTDEEMWEHLTVDHGACVEPEDEAAREQMLRHGRPNRREMVAAHRRIVEMTASGVKVGEFRLGTPRRPN